MMQSFRRALRTLVRRPGFALAAVLTLAAGLAAATAVFSLIDGVLLRPLPYENADRILGLWGQGSWSAAELDFLRREMESFEEVGAFFTTEVVYGSEDEPRVVEVAGLTPDLLRVLGSEPALGRIFHDGEEEPGHGSVVILSHRFWHLEMGGDSDVLGRTIELSDQAVEVVGVMPPGFDFPHRGVDAWFPLTIDPSTGSYGGAHYLDVLGLLAPGREQASAQAELDAVVPRMIEALDMTPGFDKLATQPHVEPYLEQVAGEARTPLYLLAASSALLLLVACANVAHLLLARAARRERELAIHSALGAARRDLVTGLVAEAVCIAAAAAGLGFLLAAWLLDLLRDHLPAGSPRIDGVALDPRAFVFGTLLALLTVFVFGLLPALRAGRVDVRDALAAGRGETSRPVRARWALVVAEMAVAACLATLAVSSGSHVVGLLSTDLGFDAEHVVTLRPELSGEEWRDPAARQAFFQRVEERLGALPEVAAVGANWRLPIAEGGAYQMLEIEGDPLGPGEAVPWIYWRAVTGDYFDAMSIRLREGRLFDTRDGIEGRQVGVISAATAERFWPDGDAVGSRLENSIDDEEWVTVIGVVDDVFHEGLDVDPGFMVYRPYAQSPAWVTSLTLVVRGVPPKDGGPEAAGLLARVRQVLRQTEPGVPIHREAILADVITESVARERLAGAVAGVYGSLALLLAAVGVFGLLAFAIAERRRELGIRMALGAGRRRIVSLVMRQGLAPALLGAVVGLGASLLFGRTLGSVLYGVDVFDAGVQASVLSILLAAAALACWLPARRAAAIDPATVLRDE